MATKPTMKTVSVKDVQITEVLVFPLDAGGFGVSAVLRALDANGSLQYEKRVRIDLDDEGNGYAQSLLTKLQALSVSLL